MGADGDKSYLACELSRVPQAVWNRPLVVIYPYASAVGRALLGAVQPGARPARWRRAARLDWPLRTTSYHVRYSRSTADEWLVTFVTS